MFHHHVSLRKIYFRSFMALIVIPIFLLFTIALSIIGYMMRKSAVENIQNSQKNIASNLTEDIRQISLQLSHFVYVNNNENMELAAKANNDKIVERYDYTKKLTDAFKVAMIPKQKIISSTFFMKNKESVYLKDEITISREKLEQESWYQEAQNMTNKVTIGSYDTSVSTITHTGLRKNQLILAAAMSPNVAVDKSGKIEMVTLFSISKAGELMQQYGDNNLLGTYVLVDQNLDAVYGIGMDKDAEKYIEHIPNKNPGVYQCKVESKTRIGKERYTYVLSKVPESNWLLVTYIKSSIITEEFNKVARVLILIILALFILFFFYSHYFLKNIIQPIQHMVEGLEKVEIGDLNTHIELEGQYEIRNMIHSFNRMVRRLKGSVTEKEEAQKKKHEAEIRALQSQINPHFLVNTLNSIRFMAQVAKFDGIRKMAEALIQILSCSFRGNASFYTIDEELKVLDSYIYLMKIRYSDGFDVTYNVEEACKLYYIPRLTLQPIVENAIVHGFEDTGEDIGHLKIVIQEEKGLVYIQITDDGKGMTEQKITEVLHPKQKAEYDNYNIGIENVYTRLKLNFGESCGLEIVSKAGEYTTIMIKLPVITNKNGAAEETSI